MEGCSLEGSASLSKEFGSCEWMKLGYKSLEPKIEFKKLHKVTKEVSYTEIQLSKYFLKAKFAI